jgi:hypothetical protein
MTASTGFASTDGRYNKINIADLRSQLECLESPLVEVSARVIAINADSSSMELFDSASKTTIMVKMNQLPKSERNALISNGVRNVTVAGRASKEGSRLVIDAQKIEVNDATAKGEPFPTSATVPLAN